MHTRRARQKKWKEDEESKKSGEQSGEWRREKEKQISDADSDQWARDLLFARMCIAQNVRFAMLRTRCEQKSIRMKAEREGLRCARQGSKAKAKQVSKVEEATRLLACLAPGSVLFCTSSWTRTARMLLTIGYYASHRVSLEIEFEFEKLALRKDGGNVCKFGPETSKCEPDKGCARAATRL